MDDLCEFSAALAWHLYIQSCLEAMDLAGTILFAIVGVLGGLTFILATIYVSCLKCRLCRMMGQRGITAFPPNVPDVTRDVRRSPFLHMSNFSRSATKVGVFNMQRDTSTNKAVTDARYWAVQGTRWGFSHWNLVSWLYEIKTIPG